MTGGEGAFGVGASRSREDEHVGDVDEGQGRHPLDDVLHQEREAFGVIDQVALERVRL